MSKVTYSKSPRTKPKAAKRSPKVEIPPPAFKHWTEENCRQAILVYGRLQASKPEVIFQAWKKAGIYVPGEYPGDWYVFRMVRRADTRLKKGK